MAVYYVLLLVPVMMQHFVLGNHRIDHNKKNQRALAFFFIFLTFLIIFRHESVGNDTRNYIRLFEKISWLDWKDVGRQSAEFGFYYLNKLVSVFTDNARVLLAIVALGVSALIYPTYKRLCKDPSLTISIFCVLSTFVMMFSGLRQMIAIAIGFIAYEFTRNKRPGLFIITVLIAMTFHTSAFMLVFMYPVYYAKITKKLLFLVIPVLMAMFVFNRQIFSVLALFIERYTDYNASITQTGAYTMLIMFAFFVAFSFLTVDEGLLDSETVGLRNFLLFAFAIQMFAPLHSLAMRMNYYYIIFIPLLLPSVIRCRSERWNQAVVVIRYVMIGFFMVYFFLIKANSGGNLNVFPYHFLWENL